MINSDFQTISPSSNFYTYRSSAELTFDHGEMICFWNSITVLFFWAAVIHNQIQRRIIAFSKSLHVAGIYIIVLRCQRKANARDWYKICNKAKDL
jgi:hypothetical protein